MIKKEIIYFGKKCILACDGNCQKAWGISSRPVNQLSDDPDDYENIPDDDLGIAPKYPGSYEGGHGKPENKNLNKWCARECERSVIVGIGEEIILPKNNEKWRNIND
jgi:hypothetical protein